MTITVYSGVTKKLRAKSLMTEQQLEDKRNPIVISVQSKYFELRAYFRELNLSQKCYLIATAFLVLYWFGWESAIRVSILLAGIALIRELNALFVGIWSKNVGKSILIVVYAASANFALAYSAIQINQVTGIEPYPFIFTLGFSTLIFTPLWISLASILLLSSLLLLMNLWLLLSVFLRLIRVQVRVHWEDKKLVFATMIMRIIHLPIICGSLLIFILPYFAGSEIDKKLAEESIKNDGVVIESDSGLDTTIFVTGEIKDSIISEDAAKRAENLKKLIASFIFHFEAYEFSKCQKQPNQRAVTVDEESVLLISQSDEQLFGYDFEVAQCVYVYEAD